MIITA